MDIHSNISALVQHGLDKKLIEPCDKAFIINRLLTPQRLRGIFNSGIQSTLHELRNRHSIIAIRAFCAYYSVVCL